MSDKQRSIAELRQRIGQVEQLVDEPDFATSEETLARYLKSTDWQMDEAERALRETMEYRRNIRPRQIECQWCHDRPGFHSMRQVGFDEVGRPVIYSNFAQAATHRNHEEDAINHVTYLIENAKNTMNPGISTWVFIIDCTGMTLQSCNPKLGYGVTQILSKHYPERLGLVLCINHNPIFHGVWKAIKMFLHQNTVAKMKLVRSKRKILQTFSKYFSDEMSSWLVDEMAANKQKPLPQPQQQFWSVPSCEKDHDPRGCPSYVAKYVNEFAENTNRGLTHLHKPHPNIVDTFSGEVKVLGVSSEESLEREESQTQLGPSSSGSDEELNHCSCIDISEEFRIPKGAVSLST